MNEPTVFIIDDDDAVRDGLALLLKTVGYQVEGFESAEAYFHSLDPLRAGCVLLDLNLPGIRGTDVQAKLNASGARIPVIFLSAYGDIPTTVRTVQAGAFDFLTKPVESEHLLERIARAVNLDRKLRLDDEAMQARMHMFARLSERERDVLKFAVNGLPNKEIARLLGISHRTVEVHRSRILLKTNASTLLELAALANEWGIIQRPADHP